MNMDEDKFELRLQKLLYSMREAKIKMKGDFDCDDRVESMTN